eukprot:6191194-Pleurochrysis_carterae.AAC.4
MHDESKSSIGHQSEQRYHDGKRVTYFCMYFAAAILAAASTAAAVRLLASLRLVSWRSERRSERQRPLCRLGSDRGGGTTAVPATIRQKAQSTRLNF